MSPPVVVCWCAGSPAKLEYPRQHALGVAVEDRLRVLPADLRTNPLLELHEVIRALDARERRVDEPVQVRADRGVRVGAELVVDRPEVAHDRLARLFPVDGLAQQVLAE